MLRRAGQRGGLSCGSIVAASASSSGVLMLKNGSIGSASKLTVARLKRAVKASILRSPPISAARS